MSLLQFVSYARKFCIALTAALGIVTIALADGVITGAEWIQIVIAFAGALGVYQAANTPKA